MPPGHIRTDPSVPVLAQRVLSLGAEAAGRDRVLVGIAGAPGAGKSTLADALLEALREALPAGEEVAHLPMDGFHLADVQLDRLGLRARKGAPETFDGHGYLATLRRLRTPDPATIYVPGFEREIEQPVAAALAIPPSARIVISEGNYLLLEEDPWPRIRALFHEVWFLDLDDDERVRRLVARHATFGKDPDAARAWALGPDQANAARILATRDQADLAVTVIG